MSSHWALTACCALVLSGCPTVDLGDTPPDIGLCNPKGGFGYFQTDIWTMYLHPADQTRDCAKSSGCHANAHGLALDPMATDLTANYRVAVSYLNCGTPMASPLLTKPLAGIDGHGGGDIFPSASDPAVNTFINWFK
jgi:hypothetical protein